MLVYIESIRFHTSLPPLGQMMTTTFPALEVIRRDTEIRFDDALYRNRSGILGTDQDETVVELRERFWNFVNFNHEATQGKPYVNHGLVILSEMERRGLPSSYLN